MFCSNCGTKVNEKEKYCFSCGLAINDKLSNFNHHEDYCDYAGLLRRALATIFDSMILLFFGIVVGSLLGFIVGYFLGSFGYDWHTIVSTTWILSFTLALILNWLYFTLFESSSWLATPGKMALRITVTDIDLNRMSFRKANARYWAKILSAITLLIGFFMTGLTKKKQALHDIIAGTIVLNSTNNRNSGDPLVGKLETLAWGLWGLFLFSVGLVSLLFLLSREFIVPFQLIGLLILSVFIFAGGIMMNDNFPAFRALRNAESGTRVHLVSHKLHLPN